MSAEFERDVTSNAACAPGDVDPEWICLAHPFDSFEEVLNTSLSLRWEVLERVITLGDLLVLRAGWGVAPGVDFLDFITDFHFGSLRLVSGRFAWICFVFLIM